MLSRFASFIHLEAYGFERCKWTTAATCSKKTSQKRLNVTEAKNIDPAELSRFSRMADQWWDPKGDFAALHDINPVRLAYVQERAGLAGQRVLDVGCGGGLLSEAMARAGACVTAIDMSPAGLAAARNHMREAGLAIDYRQSAAEDLARKAAERFDIVTCMELLEHVPDPAAMVNACGRLARPGGHVFFATVNRTWLSHLLVIGFSEYLFRIVGRGTHTYHKFVQPDELLAWGRAAGLKLSHLSGLRYIPFIRYAALCRGTAMNYVVHFAKRG
jgi:2-polyprenyl-6-hydroxyphenyl methylase/3-demethylubiquinone-9 3-methyltransferase